MAVRTGGEVVEGDLVDLDEAKRHARERILFRAGLAEGGEVIMQGGGDQPDLLAPFVERDQRVRLEAEEENSRGE